MIVSTIQSVVERLTTPTAFIYANLFEANGDLGIPGAIQDEGKTTYFVYIPPSDVTDETEDNPLIHTIFPFNFKILKKLEEPTSGYRSVDVEPFIDQCRELTREFIHSLNSEDIVENGNTVNGNVREGISIWKMENLYGEFDIHLFGVAVTCQLPIQEGKTGCV